ncbi:M20/M25/M40 family metallo-hydrolase [Actinoplanes sp. NPDC026623]|uniref:M20 metallopeptidase family protein n=1 Tax=Actinoplanes sp. NPDC026623 TaxID=3155610 RepID=UPI0033CB7FC9
MSNRGNRGVSRRAVLSGAAAAASGVWLAPATAARAGTGAAATAVDAVASALDRELIELRRSIHRHPETAGLERRTAAVVARRLRAAGLRVTTGVGGYGVVAVLDGARAGRTVAYRADMDAVAPKDQVAGGTEAAHLCGHDLHTTIGVGVAQVLARLRARLAGRVVFVFQPAEEALTGAAAMLADGVLARTRPAEIHALHCGPFPVGNFVVMPGTGLPGQDRGTITVTGADAAARARRLADEISALGTVSRPATPADLERLVAELQMPDGPLAGFIFMQARAAEFEDRAEVQISYRCWPQERYAEVREAINGLAGSAGGAAASFPNDPFPAMVTPLREGLALQEFLHRTVGRDRTQRLYAAIPYSGEDFALFLNRIPGSYAYLGVRAPGAAIETSYPHFGTFDPDERAIGHGVRAMAGWLASRTHAGAATAGRGTI